LSQEGTNFLAMRFSASLAYTNLCEQARNDAYELMIQHARELGANGIIAVRYDATEIAPGVSEVLCYGTAVHAVAR